MTQGELLWKLLLERWYVVVVSNIFKTLHQPVSRCNTTFTRFQYILHIYEGMLKSMTFLRTEFLFTSTPEKVALVGSNYFGLILLLLLRDCICHCELLTYADKMLLHRRTLCCQCFQ